MKHKTVWFLTLTFLISFLPGCASLFQGDPDFADSTYSSQAAPEPPDRESPEYHETRVPEAIRSADIVLGMYPQEVVSAWGRPREVQVAGDSSLGNERWLYYTSNSLRYGIGQTKIIYFENGRVAGWETQR